MKWPERKESMTSKNVLRAPTTEAGVADHLPSVSVDLVWSAWNPLQLLLLYSQGRVCYVALFLETQ